MDILSLIALMQNKLNYLGNARAAAVSVGDVSNVTAIEQELLTTKNTLAQLEFLQQLNQAAAAQNTTSAAIMADTLQTVPSVQGPSASAVINGYDISAYATDPLYEQKITNILAAMPVFTAPADLTHYIQTIAPGSPVSGDMVYSAAGQYAVDILLMTAIMQNDSQFGTQGVAVSTNNPGNVGNTGIATHTYPSWMEGVSAVAEWLSRHRVVITPVTPIPDTTTPVPSAVTPPASTVDSNATTTPDLSLPTTISSTTPAVATTTDGVVDTATSTTP